MDSARPAPSDRFGAELEKLAEELTEQVGRVRRRLQEERLKLETRSFRPVDEEEPPLLQ
jgi:hypothetical protein